MQHIESSNLIKSSTLQLDFRKKKVVVVVIVFIHITHIPHKHILCFGDMRENKLISIVAESERMNFGVWKSPVTTTSKTNQMSNIKKATVTASAEINFSVSEIKLFRTPLSLHLTAPA